MHAGCEFPIASSQAACIDRSAPDGVQLCSHGVVSVFSAEGSPRTELQGRMPPLERSPDVSPGIHLSEVDVHWLWRECYNRLEAYRAAVRRGEQLGEALNFSRFIQNAHIVAMFERNPQFGHLKVDGRILRHNCQELESDIQEAVKRGTGGPLVEEDYRDLKALNRKVDVLAGHISKLVIQQEAEAAGQRACSGRMKGGDPTKRK